MPDPTVDVLTCPECHNVIRTEKTVDKPGETQITCPSCKKQSPLSVFRTCKTQSVAASNAANESGSGQVAALVFLAWLIGVPLIFISIASLVFAIESATVGTSSYSRDASLGDIYRKLTQLTGLVQMLVFGKLLLWSFNLIRKAST